MDTKTEPKFVNIQGKWLEVDRLHIYGKDDHSPNPKERSVWYSIKGNAGFGWTTLDKIK